MRKSADYIAPLSAANASHGQYRVRIYEEDGALPVLPVVIVTNPTPGEAFTTWLSNDAPRLVAWVARKDLLSYHGLRWLTRYATTTGEELFESSAFALIEGGQAVYREPPRFGEPAPLEPQASICTRADVESLVGQSLG